MITHNEFIAKIRAACDAYGIHEFALYGRFAHTVGPTGLLQPPDRYAYCDGDGIVAEEAAYHMDRIATTGSPE